MFYLTSSGLHCKTGSCIHIVYKMDRYVREAIDKVESKAKIIHYLPKSQVEGTDFSRYDTMVLHGGDVSDIYALLVKQGLIDVIKFFCKHKIFIGVSAGALILSQRSTFIRDDQEFYHNELDTELIGVSKLRFDVHYDMLRQNKTYMESLAEASLDVKQPIFLLENGAYIKDDKEMHGNIFKIVKGEITSVN